jgi:dTDP-4-amino-4,6-dideoxygalactose transaminase
MTNISQKTAIPLIDLPAQYAQIKEVTDPKVLDILASGAYIGGSEVSNFEAEAAKFLETQHVISCANGSDALYIALLALGIGAGDEVITSNFTYIASSESIDQCGAKPVLADIDVDNFNIDPKSIESKITSKTKAIIVVHLYGQAAAMTDIMLLARKHNIAVIEDTAQSFGTKVFYNNKWHYAGTVGDIGTYSFYPTKNLSCAGDGGMLSTNDAELAERISVIKAHGSKKRYYHSCLGVNSRLDAIQACILREKLKHIQSWNGARALNADRYYENLTDFDNIILPKRETDYSSHIFHQFTIKINPALVGSDSNSPLNHEELEVTDSLTDESDRSDPAEISQSKSNVTKLTEKADEIHVVDGAILSLNSLTNDSTANKEDKSDLKKVYTELEQLSKLRDNLRNHLKEHNIASEIYYPLALHAQEVYTNLNLVDNDYLNTLYAAASVLSIPIYPELGIKNVDFISNTIKDFFK